MLFKDVLHAAAGLSYYTLGIIALVLTVGVVASLMGGQRGRSGIGGNGQLLGSLDAAITRGS
jgi:hypothetical protein